MDHGAVLIRDPGLRVDLAILFLCELPKLNDGIPVAAGPAGSDRLFDQAGGELGTADPVKIEFFVRSAGELAAIIAENPFPDATQRTCS
jgi:hypothetical protein